MTCKECDIPDVNCYEQCKDINKCIGCFGASMNDCAECEHDEEKKNK